MASLLSFAKHALADANPFDGPRPVSSPPVRQQPIQNDLSVRPVYNPTLVQAAPRPIVPLQVRTAIPQPLQVGNQTIQLNPHIRTQTPERNAFLQERLHPNLGQQIKTGLGQKLVVPLAAAQQVQELGQLVARTVPEVAATAVNKTYHPGSRAEKLVFGSTPVQSIQQKVEQTYTNAKKGNHPNFALPAAVGEGLASVAMDLPVVGLGAKAAKPAAKLTEKVISKRVPLNEVGGIRPYDKLQSDIEKAHNAGDKKLEAKLTAQLPDQGMNPNAGLSPKAKAELVAQARTKVALTPEEAQMGKALGMSEKDVIQAKSQAIDNNLPPGTSRIEQRLSGTERKGLPTSSLPKDIAQKPLGTNTYPLQKKVNALDYLRTPEKVLNKIGLKSEAQGLIQADHQYKQVLPKELDKITTWSKQVNNDPAASQRIFQKLDGQKIALNPSETKVAGEIKQYLGEWANRLGLPNDKRITNYITHIFDKELVAKEFDPELEKLIANKVPGSVYDPFTQQRLGKQGYKEDVFQALDAYVKRATRKEAFDPALDKLSSAAEGLDKSGYDYVKKYGDRINMRPTDLDNLIDSAIKQSPVGYKLGQRPTAAISRNVRQATYRATLGLNFGSAVRNLTQGINTFAELGTRWTGIGYTKALEAIAKNSDELKRVGVLDNSFIEDRTVSALKQNVQRLDKGLWAFFQGAEKVNRGAAYYGAKAKALNQGRGLEQAIKEGVAAARKTQFTFGKVDTPVALQSDIVKIFTQFQSYNAKQIEFIGEMVKNKEFVKLLRLTGASAVVFATVGRALGYRPSDMLPSPQIGQAPALKVPGAVKDAVDRKTGKAAMKLGSAVGSATIPGFVQVKKSVTGYNAANRGEVKKGSKTLVVPKTTGNKVKGTLFGPYSLNGVPKKEAKQKAEPGGSLKAGGYTQREAKALNPDRQQAWSDMTAKARKNVSIYNPNLYIKRQGKVIEQERASGQTTKAFKDNRNLQKIQITRNYDKNLVGAYGLNAADFKAYLIANPTQVTKLQNLDAQLVDAGLVSKSKFTKATGYTSKAKSTKSGSSKVAKAKFSTTGFKTASLGKISLPKGVKVRKVSYKAPKTRKIAVSKIPRIA